MLPLDQNNRRVVSWDTRCVSLDSCPPFFFVAEIAVGPAPGHGPVRMHDLRMEISQKDKEISELMTLHVGSASTTYHNSIILQR